MLTRLTSRLSYANVVATLALFLALGGTSYAALTITGKNVKNGSLSGGDIKDGSITAKDIKNGSLLEKDFKSGQLPGPVEAFNALGGGTTVSGTGDTVVASLDVPAGAYAVVARVRVQNPSPAGKRVDAVCTLDAVGSTELGEQPLNTLNPTTGGDTENLAFTTISSLAEPGTMKVKCNATTADEKFDVGSASLTAIRVTSSSFGPTR